MPAKRPSKQPASDEFYCAFEDKWRGARDVIRSRLSVYLPFIEPLLALHTPASAVDLGCGRGEWLELLRDAGFDGRGVDIDSGMLATCRKYKLRVEKGDAVAFLKKLPAASQMIVSGFHIAEHLPFSDLRLLVEEALRVLKPAGLLILETPNPENLMVGATNFYMDPTHKRPLPPQLLSFLPEYYGYARVKVIRLQERPELTNTNKASLGDVLCGVSPDYAVVAQKAAEEAVMNATGQAYEAEYGLTLDKLVGRFDHHLSELSGGSENLMHFLKVAQADSTAQNAGFAQAAKAWECVTAALTSELTAKTETIAELNRRSANAEERIAMMTEERNKLAALTSEVAVKTETIAELNRRLLNAEERIAMVTEERNELAALTSEVAVKTETIAELNRRLLNAEERIAMVTEERNELAALTSEVAVKIETIAELDRRLLNAEERIAMVTEERNGLAVKEVARSTEIEALEAKLAETVKEREALDAKIDHLYHEHGVLLETLATTNNRAEKLEASLAETAVLQKAFNTATNAIVERDERLALLDRQTAETQAAITLLETLTKTNSRAEKLETSLAEATVLHNAFNAATDAIVERDERLILLDRRAAELEAETAATLRETLATTKSHAEKLETSRAEATALNQAFTTAKEEIAERNERIAVLDRQAAEADAAITAIRSSASWRIAAPVRWAGRGARALIAPMKPIVRPVLEAGLALVRRFTGLKPIVLACASIIPRARQRLVDFSQVRGERRSSVPGSDAAAPPPVDHARESGKPAGMNGDNPIELDFEPEGVKQVYHRLIEARRNRLQQRAN